MNKQIHNKHPTLKKVIIVMVMVVVVVSALSIPISALTAEYVSDYETTLKTPIVPTYQIRFMYGGYGVTGGSGYTAPVYITSESGDQNLEIYSGNTHISSYHGFVDTNGEELNTLTSVGAFVYGDQIGEELYTFGCQIGEFWLDGQLNHIYSDIDQFGGFDFYSTYDTFDDEIQIEIYYTAIVDNSSNGTYRKVSTNTVGYMDRFTSGENDSYHHYYALGEALYFGLLYDELPLNDGETIVGYLVNGIYIEHTFLNTFTEFGNVQYAYIADANNPDNEWTSQVTPKASLYNNLNAIRPPRLDDVDLGALGTTLGSAVDGFFQFEIGGVPISLIFTSVFALILVVAILKFFAGG